MIKGKIGFIDFLKGVAIFLVIYGHCLQYGSGAAFLQQGVYWENGVMKVIYSFHMPLFVAISGYLYSFSIAKYGALDSFLRRVKSFLPICASWAVIYFIFDVVRGKEITFSTEATRVLRFFLTDFWFLWTVIICVSCIALVESLAEKTNGGGGTLYILSYSCFFSSLRIHSGLTHINLCFPFLREDSITPKIMANG